MAKEVVKAETKAVGAPLPPVMTPHIGADDLLVPKILLMQQMSDKVKGKNPLAKVGEYRDSVENKLFGSDEKPFEFIPVYMTSFWAEYEIVKVGNETVRKYSGQVTIDASNEHWPRNETKNGKTIDRMKTYEAFVLIPEEVKAGLAFPYVLSFRSTSIRAGKTLLTQMYVRNSQAKIQPYEIVCEISATEKENDKGEYYVSETKPKRKASKEEIEAATYWLNMIASGSVRKDDSDLEDAASHGGGETEMKNANSQAF